MATGTLGIIEDLVTARDAVGGCLHGITIADVSQNVPDRDDVARIIMRIFINSRQSVAFLEKMNGLVSVASSPCDLKHVFSAGLEISKSSDGGTLFRGNSMATKVWPHNRLSTFRLDRRVSVHGSVHEDCRTDVPARDA